MAFDYSVEVCKDLEKKFHEIGLSRPMRIGHYDAGTELTYEVAAVENGDTTKIRLSVEKFVGGGFAGQVYRVKITDIDTDSNTFAGLSVGAIYAMKILIPPSGFSNLFRNILYAVGFQGPFQLQVNPQAARSGAIWQKLIRRAAIKRFGDDGVVNDIHATFVDSDLGSCGELSDWVEGRTWRLEVDENLDTLKKWKRKKHYKTDRLGSPEYRAKHDFMHSFVKLLNEMGAQEFARQYEWSTCKSQPNCLKRTSTEDDPAAGLTAVDFRAGLALLCFLPMSPGDFKLIAKGLARGTLVQFDRGNIKKLESFIAQHAGDFENTETMIEDLKQCEDNYRNSLPDITHNHFRLLYSRKLWSTILSSSITGWRIRNLIDENGEQKLRSCKIFTFFFYILGLLPFINRPIRKLLAHDSYRKHYIAMLTRPNYLIKAIKGRMVENTTNWYRDGRVTEQKAKKISQCIVCFSFHLIFSILPVGLHKFLTDPAFMKEKLSFIFVRPFKLYFNKHMREQWLRDMLIEGKKKHIITDEDVSEIESQMQEPYIQRYLVSLVVHLMTLPVTQVVGLIIALINWQARDLTWDQALAQGAIIMGTLQVVPLSPGSICRGLYTTGLAIHDRNFKDYNIALFLSYFKYVGYLAFPIQMTYRYPTLARFMAGHWATDAVHIVPVFGERGALLEHWVFCLFYNWPLTIRRKMASRAKIRSAMKPRYWHIPCVAILAAAIFSHADKLSLNSSESLPGLKDIWYLILFVPLFAGVIVTAACGGAALLKRISSAAICGITTAIIYTAVSTYLGQSIDFFSQEGQTAAGIFTSMFIWRIFLFAIFSTTGALLTELIAPDPDIR